MSEPRSPGIPGTIVSQPMLFEMALEMGAFPLPLDHRPRDVHPERPPLSDCLPRQHQVQPHGRLRRGLEHQHVREGVAGGNLRPGRQLTHHLPRGRYLPEQPPAVPPSSRTPSAKLQPV